MVSLVVVHLSICLLQDGVGALLQVLEVAAGQLVVGNDLDLAVTLLGDLDGLAEVADAALDLDLVLQELLEGVDIEDLVGGRLGGVDDELRAGGARKSAKAVPKQDRKDQWED